MKYLRRIRPLLTPLIAGLVFLAATGLLLEDRSIIGWVVKVPADLARLGEAEYASGQVKRQSVFLQVWLDLGRRDTLYDGDRIFVGTGGSARLRLQDLASIELHENTLIELSLENGIPKISAESGEAEVTFLRDGQLLAQIGETVELIEGKRDTKLKIKNDPASHDTSIEVAEGQARVGNLDAKDGERIAVDQDGSLSKSSGQVTLLSPDRGDVTVAPSERVDFKWNVAGGSPEVELKIETDEDHAKVIHAQTTREPHLTYTFAEPGHYVWSVRRAGSRARVEPHNLQVRFNDRPLILEPRNGRVVDLDLRRIEAAVARMTESATPAGPESAGGPPGLDLHWVDESWTGRFQAQVADDPGFAKISRDLDVPNGQLARIAVGAGTHYVRIRRKHDVAAAWSPAVDFVVKDRASDIQNRGPATPSGEAYPYPAVRATVLAHAPGQIDVRPRARCERACRLTVAQDGRAPRTADIAAGQSPHLAVEIDPAHEGPVRWTLEGEATGATQGEFLVLGYSKSNLERTIRENSPTEVLN